MKILVIDNYDSFTFNLVHYLEGAGAQLVVWRTDEIRFEELANFDGVVISPGPGLPAERPELFKLLDLVEKPVLGVCLGLQAIGEFFGGTLYNQQKVMHGVSVSCCRSGDSRLLNGLPEQFPVGLYHSWALKKEGMPAALKVTAESENKVVMAIEHESLPVFGVQFHPESILTENGHEIIQNFLLICREMC